MSEGETLLDHHSLVLYDGVCGLCNRLVQFLLESDRDDRLRFAALQSPLGIAIMEQQGRDPSRIDTMALLERPEPGSPVELYTKAKAASLAIARLGGFWRIFALAAAVPAFLANPLYDLLASVRYRLFGRYDTCPLPSPEWQDRFLDDAALSDLLGPRAGLAD